MLFSCTRFALIFAGAIVLHGFAHAEVVFTGPVSPGRPSEVNEGTRLAIGFQGFSNSASSPVDPRATVVVDDGSTLEAAEILVSEDAASIARLLVSGPETRVAARFGGFQLPSIQVGARGDGYLSVSDGAWLDAERIVIGSDGQPVEGFANATARADFAGLGTLVSARQGFAVGGVTDARLSVSDGAVIQASGFGFGSNAGFFVNDGGVAEFHGDATRLKANLVTVGTQNQDLVSPYPPAELVVGSQAVVDAIDFGEARAVVAGNGRLALEGGVVGLPTTVAGRLSGDGRLTRSLTVAGSGEVLVGAGQAIEVSGGLQNGGRIDVAGGGLEVTGTYSDDSRFNSIFESAMGSVQATNAELRFRGAAEVTHLMQIAGGAAVFEGGLEIRSFGEVRGQVFVADASVRLEGRSEIAGVLEITGSTFEISDFPSLGSDFGLVQSGDLRVTNSTLRVNAAIQNQGRVELRSTEVALERDFFNQPDRFGGGGLVLDGVAISSSGCCGGSIRNGSEIRVRGTGNHVLVPIEDGFGSLVVEPDAQITLGSADFQAGVQIGAGASVESASRFWAHNPEFELSSTNLVQPGVLARSPLPQQQAARVELFNTLSVDRGSLTGVEAGQEYHLVEADALVTSFVEIDLPDLPGTLEFLPEATDTTLSLRVIDTTLEIPGDFNADGVVDTADYTLWRDGLPGGSQWLDRELWRANFGRELASATGALANGSGVPEPTAAWLLLGTLVAARRLSRTR